jgi:hypothetical protein
VRRRIREACFLAAASALALGAGEALDARLAAAASRLLASLGDEERAEARFAFGDPEREDVRYAPLLLDGARHGELAPQAASRLDELLAVSLSPSGLAKVRRIRALEAAVARKDRGRALGLGRLAAPLRDPGRYFVAVFGEPRADSPWGFRYEGHHLSLNVTVASGGVPAVTPLFLGAEPRIVPDGWPEAGAQVLGPEEELARALHAALPTGLRERATLPFSADRGDMLGQVRRVALGEPRGVARSELPPPAQARLDALVEVFLANFPEEIASARRAEIDSAGRDALRFAWAETRDPPGAFYWRIQGPRTLVEVDNTTDGDHVHAVWHDVPGDFGGDLLAAHYRADHGVALASLGCNPAASGVSGSPSASRAKADAQCAPPPASSRIRAGVRPNQRRTARVKALGSEKPVR